MINWFGPASWGAPICFDAPRCDIPVGTFCVRCEVAIAEHDEGVTMPGSVGPVTYHLACHLKSVLSHAQWSAHGLVPTMADGAAADGSFECSQCNVVYRPDRGWSRRR